MPGVLLVEGITPDADIADRAAVLGDMAAARLAGSTEGEFPRQAWRRAFTRMGLRPAQYRCASESLLRRCRKDGSLPRLNPLVDLCNATSIAFAIPVAAFDVDRIQGDLQVRCAPRRRNLPELYRRDRTPRTADSTACDGAVRASLAFTSRFLLTRSQGVRCTVR